VLRELQLAFLEAVAGGARDPALERLIVGDARLDAAGRLDIYADMYRLRLRAALAATFPLTAQALGDEAFAARADAYFAAHPSRAPSLRDAGARFPELLEGWRADLARLEWARHDVFDAVDEATLDEAAVRARGPEGIAELPVRLVAAHRRVAVAFAVEPVWRALADDGAPDGAEPGPRTLLVWREGVTVYHRRVDAVEDDAPAAAAAGLAFGALCERLAETLGAEAAPRRAGELLRRWLHDQLLAAL